MTQSSSYRAFYLSSKAMVPNSQRPRQEAVCLPAETPCLVWSYGDSAEMGPQDADDAIEIGKDERGHLKMVRGSFAFTWQISTVGAEAASRACMNTRLVVLVRGRVDEDGRQRWVPVLIESLGEELERLRAVVAQYETEQAPSSVPLIDQNKLTAAWSAAEGSM